MKGFKLAAAAVSMSALLASTAAFAQTQEGTGMNMKASPGMEDTVRTDGTADDLSTTMKENIQEGWEDTKETVEKAANKAESTVKSAYKKIKASIINDDPKAEPAATTINEEMTARGMLGKPVHDQNSRRVATLSDIILDSEGAARLVVVKDGNFPNLGGKLVALDYDAVIDRTQDGDILMPISQRSIDAAAEFSYKADAGGGVRVVPENGYSVDRLLDGKLLAFDGREELANIDNISFLNGRATQIIAVYNQILGMGGDRVVMDFRTANLVRNGNGGINLKLSQTQTEKLKNFKEKSGGVWRLGSAY